MNSSQVFAGVSFALVAIVAGYLVLSVVLSRVARPVRLVGGRLPLMYVFVIPALNEERVIAGTLGSLLALAPERVHVIVVDDGSDDGTAEIVRGFAGRRVDLLQRRGGQARQGKGAVLNYAFSHLCTLVDKSGLDSDDVVLAVVDADGRACANMIDAVDPYFADQSVGAVQVLVRIANRDRLLGRFQDYEFVAFGALAQTAREHLGSVALGGNGQFARLSALRSLGSQPWTGCLTEDLDLGIRLVIAGWVNRYVPETHISQQGLLSVGRLLRQRARWSQGHFQCWRHIPGLYNSDLRTVTVLDLSYYLLSPGLVLVASVVFPIPATVVAYHLILDPPFGGVSLLVYVVTLYVLSFATSIGLSILYWRRAGDMTLAKALVVAHGLAIYNWIWYVAEWWAIARMIRGREEWAKTPRHLETVTA